MCRAGEKRYVAKFIVFEAFDNGLLFFFCIRRRVYIEFNGKLYRNTTTKPRFENPVPTIQTNIYLDTKKNLCQAERF